ncbi:uncharacterized protein BDV14DRAFT_171713 [Aspergillus stella-maris]|uniref:uncharacterized protein n=1 Tax=Aspergillus stella-maris TaxID=1810926 RepID=UPI003CCD9189
MARSSPLWLVYLAVTLFSPRTLAWTFLWRNETTNAHIENGQSAQNCTQAWHQEGEQFSWDPEGTWCLKLYSDAKCEHTNGIACEPYLWRKDASQNISAFLVYPMPPSSITAFGLDSITSATSTPTPSPTTASTTTPTDASAEETPTGQADSNDDGGLSGGAIAGIVVGAVAAVAILCVAFFFLGLRNRKKAAAAAAAAASAESGDSNTGNNPSSLHSENPSSNATLFDTGPMVAELPKSSFVQTHYVSEQANHIQPPNGRRMMELPGNEPGHELSNSAQVQEMLGTTQVQELEGEPMGKRKSR